MTRGIMSKEEKLFWNYGDEPASEAPDGAAPPTRALITRIVDSIMKDGFCKRRYSKLSLWDASFSLDDPRIIRLIAEHPKKWMPIHKMLDRLEAGSRFEFWKCIFMNRKYIPQKELLQVWFGCLNDHGSLTYQKVTMPNDHRTCFEEFFANVSDPELQKTCSITDPLLIDDPIVSFRYCQVKKPGWEMLRYIHGRRHQTLPIPEEQRQAIREDFLPCFAIHFDMSHQKLSFSLLAEILEAGATSIFRHLLENDMLSDKVIPLSELCCCLTARFSDDFSIPMLTILEEMRPGLLKGVKDIFGRNLLWYAVQNMRTGWFHPDCKLTPFLLEHGCDPQNTNQLDLPWNFVFTNLSHEQKILLMRRRYNIKRYSTQTANLRKAQPMERI